MAEISRRVAYFTGCFVNYYYPPVGEATLKVLGKNGIEVVVPDQVCCGLPMMAKGNIRGAYRNMARNVEVLGRLVREGYALITTCSSCALFLRQDYPRLLPTKAAQQVGQNLYYISDYLLKLHEVGRLRTDFGSLYQTIFYHSPCHLRAQTADSPSVRLLQLIPGITMKKTSRDCCGMGGAYGNEKANYELSQQIAARLFQEIKQNPTDLVVTDCGGCKLQIEAGTGLRVDHPIILLAQAYGLLEPESEKSRSAV